MKIIESGDYLRREKFKMRLWEIWKPGIALSRNVRSVVLSTVFINFQPFSVASVHRTIHVCTEIRVPLNSFEISWLE